MTLDDKESLELLEALSQVKDIKDFRLSDFMREHGMNPSQPVIFHRRLIKEARENKAYMKFLDGLIDYNHKEIAKLEADVLAKDKEIKNLRARVGSLQGATSKKIDNLDKERQGLKATASQLEQKAEDYELLREFLRGRMHPNTVERLYHYFYDLHMEQLYADIDRQPSPARLEAICQKLRQTLADMLHIPPNELEKKLVAQDAKIKELDNRCKALAVVTWIEYQQALKGEKPEENEKPQENDDAKIEADFYKRLQDLADKRCNETTEGGG